MDIRLAEADNDLTAFLTMRADTRHMIMTALREAAAAREARLKEHECSAFDPCDACAELMVEADDMGTLAEYAVEADWLGTGINDASADSPQATPHKANKRRI